MTMTTMNKKRWLCSLFLTGALVAGLVGCSALDERQRQLIFNPNISRWSHSSELQDVWIPFTSRLTAEPVQLHALWLGQNPPQLDSQQPVLLYLHGARWDVWASRGRIERLHELGFSVLAIDYRGFGQTTSGLSGSRATSNTLPSESMAYEDAQAAWNWLGQHFPHQQRYIYGHSLGGAIAIDLASKVDDEAGTMVEATFSSVRDVFSTTRWGWLPIGPLLTQRFESIDKVRRIGSPLLVVHGTADDVIKPELGQRLFDAASTPKEMILVEGGNHHNTSTLGFDQYRLAIQQLFGIAPPPAPADLAGTELAQAASSASDVVAAGAATEADARRVTPAATPVATSPRGHSAATGSS